MIHLWYCCRGNRLNKRKFQLFWRLSNPGSCLNRILLINEVLPTNVRFTLAKECHRNLSDIRHSTFKIGAVNRSPVLFRPSSNPLRTLTLHPPLSLLPTPSAPYFPGLPPACPPDELVVFLLSNFSILLLLSWRCSRPG